MFVFTILGYLCFAFAFVDVLLNNVFGVDITGVIWSPIAAGLTLTKIPLSIIPQEIIKDQLIILIASLPPP